jgi:hypothetical protein
MDEKQKNSSISPTSRNSVDFPTDGSVQTVRLEQTFNLWSTLGIAFSFIATPLSIGSYLVFSLSAGGSPYFVWGYVVSFVMNTLIAVSLAEIAGFLPHTSGELLSSLLPRVLIQAGS